MHKSSHYSVTSLKKKKISFIRQMQGRNNVCILFHGWIHACKMLLSEMGLGMWQSRALYVPLAVSQHPGQPCLLLSTPCLSFLCASTCIAWSGLKVTLTLWSPPQGTCNLEHDVSVYLFLKHVSLYWKHTRGCWDLEERYLDQGNWKSAQGAWVCWCVGMF